MEQYFLVDIHSVTDYFYTTPVLRSSTLWLSDNKTTINIFNQSIIMTDDLDVVVNLVKQNKTLNRL